jgi:hypothetical protein
MQPATYSSGRPMASAIGRAGGNLPAPPLVDAAAAGAPPVRAQPLLPVAPAPAAPRKTKAGAAQAALVSGLDAARFAGAAQGGADAATGMLAALLASQPQSKSGARSVHAASS